MMYCKECGAKLFGKYCSKCGARSHKCDEEEFLRLHREKRDFIHDSFEIKRDTFDLFLRAEAFDISLRFYEHAHDKHISKQYCTEEARETIMRNAEKVRSYLTFVVSQLER